MLTWPSPPMATRPRCRMQSTVVARMVLISEPGNKSLGGLRAAPLPPQHFLWGGPAGGPAPPPAAAGAGGGGGGGPPPPAPPPPPRRGGDPRACEQITGWTPLT